MPLQFILAAGKDGNGITCHARNTTDAGILMVYRMTYMHFAEGTHADFPTREAAENFALAVDDPTIIINERIGMAEATRGSLVKRSWDALGRGIAMKNMERLIDQCGELEAALSHWCFFTRQLSLHLEEFTANSVAFSNIATEFLAKSRRPT